MGSGGRWMVPGSPLDGRRVPMDWNSMDSRGQRSALVSYGYARSFEEACRVMGRHAAATMRARREREDRAAKARHPEGDN